MGLGLGLTPIVDLNGTAWSIKKGQITRLDSINDIGGPRLVITDFALSRAGIESVNTTKRFASAIVEKTLRKRGDTEGSSEIISLHAHKVSSSIDLSYVAVPSKVYATYEAYTNHGDHHLIVPLHSLLLNYAVSHAGKNGRGICLFNHGLFIDVVAVENGYPTLIDRVISSGSSESQLANACDYLADLLRDKKDMLSDGTQIYWFDFNTVSDEPDLILNLASAKLGHAINKVSTKSFKTATGQVSTAIRVLINSAAQRSVVKTGLAKHFFMAEKALPYIAITLMALSATLAATGMDWQKKARLLQEEKVQVSQKIDMHNINEMKDVIPVALDSTEAHINMAFIDELSKATQMPSLLTIMSDMKRATPEGVRIVSFSLETKRDLYNKLYPAGIMVEGIIEKELSKANQDLAFIVATLKKQGYSVEDRGIVNHSGSHAFQLLLLGELSS